MPGGCKLSQKGEVAIAALLNSKSIEEAAQTVGVHERTLKHWLTKPAFRKAYRTARRQLVEVALSRLQSVLGKAVATLEDLLDASHPGVRLGAAKAILEQCNKAVELDDLAEQLDQLKRQIGAAHHDRVSPGTATGTQTPASDAWPAFQSTELPPPAAAS
jgi:hypothetical protein